jgi:hypothetical protein
VRKEILNLVLERADLEARSAKRTLGAKSAFALETDEDRQVLIELV